MNRDEHTAIVCQSHKLTQDDLRGWSKKPPIVAARRELMHRLCVVAWVEAMRAGADPLKAQFQHSLTSVGTWLRKDHTTALYAIRTLSAEVYGTRPRASLAEMRAAYAESLQAEKVAA